MNRQESLEILKKAETGTIQIMGCSECEGLEQHVKQADGTWKCLNCDAQVIKL